jgi:hypothetical protein
MLLERRLCDLPGRFELRLLFWRTKGLSASSPREVDAVSSELVNLM